jgi:hypothetical protein
MKTYKTPLCRRVVIALVTAGVLGLVYSPTPAPAVEREGATLFFSFAELGVMVSGLTAMWRLVRAGRCGGIKTTQTSCCQKVS